MRLAILLSAMLLSACASSRPVQLTAPTADRTTTMDCVLAEADARNYVPQGSSAVVAGTSAVITLERDRAFDAKEAGKEVASRVLTLGLKGVNSATRDGIRASIAGGSLRLVSTAQYDNGNWGKPTPEGLADANAILKACAKP